MTSTIKVNNIQNQCGANIINENSNTITIGASGDTIALASGASQSGFGRSGSVDWQTTVKTGSFTAASGEGYFINSSSGITVSLPAGTAGAIVAVADYARNFATYNLTISPNGSQKIGGTAANATLNVNGQAATFVYADDTKGWINVQNAEDTETGQTPAFIAASGGNCVATVCTNFKVHTFTSPGTFTVSCAGNAAGSNTVDYLVIAGGGGGGGSNYSGGGGASGGYRFSSGTASGCYSAGPAPLGATALPISPGGIPITVGGGGAGGTYPGPQIGVNGTNSVFSSITSAGGGYGGGGNGVQGGAGGSGGGNSGDGSPNPTAAAGNTPPVSPPQGFPGGIGFGSGPSFGAGGGGGASEAGGNGSAPIGGAGGDGLASSITSAAVTRGGGGGGGIEGGTDGPGGAGGGGAGSNNTGVAGTVNTGGGGGGAGNAPHAGGAGGSGIVIIRYRFQ